MLEKKKTYSQPQTGSNCKFFFILASFYEFKHVENNINTKNTYVSQRIRMIRTFNHPQTFLTVLLKKETRKQVNSILLRVSQIHKNLSIRWK